MKTPPIVYVVKAHHSTQFAICNSPQAAIKFARDMLRISGYALTQGTSDKEAAAHLARYVVGNPYVFAAQHMTNRHVLSGHILPVRFNERHFLP